MGGAIQFEFHPPSSPKATLEFNPPSGIIKKVIYIQYYAANI